MKNYERTAALLLSASIILCCAGCSDKEAEETGVIETCESMVETSETAVETTAETTEETVPPRAPLLPLDYSVNVSDDQTTYDAYAVFVDSLAESYDGEILFSYSRYYYEGVPRWQLQIVYPDLEMTEVYECVDGDVVYAGTLDYCDTNALPYDVFRALPCMCYSYHSVTGAEMSDINDGRYFGSIEAAAVDGSYLLLLIGDPFILTEEEYWNLEVGDVIDTPPMYEGDDPGMTVTAVVDTGENRHVQIDNGYECWFVKGSYTEDPTDYILMTNSDNPVWFNTRMIIVPVAGDCEVTDTYSFLISNGDDSQFEGWNTDPDANAFTSSVFWYYETQVRIYLPEEVNGWVPTEGGLAYPVVIENGEVTSINIEWR